MKYLVTVLIILAAFAFGVIIYKSYFRSRLDYSQRFLNEEMTFASGERIRKDYEYEVRKDFEKFKRKWANSYFAKPNPKYIPLSELEQQINDGISEQIFKDYIEGFITEKAKNKEMVDFFKEALKNWRDINCKGEIITIEQQQLNTCDSQFGFYNIARMEGVKL